MPRSNEVPVLGPDGVPRGATEQRRINDALASAFRGEAGKAALDYLRSISIERVSGPEIGDHQLRHLEGMRHIVAIISQRISAHHKEKMNAGTGSPDPRAKRRTAFAVARRTEDPG